MKCGHPCEMYPECYCVPDLEEYYADVEREEDEYSRCGGCGATGGECNCEIDQEESWLELGICCWDPRYDGPKDHCACKEATEEQYKSLSKKDKFLIWFRAKRFNITKAIEGIFRGPYNQNELPF